MPGETYHPLGLSGHFDDQRRFKTDPDSEYRRFRKAAKQGDPLDELIGLTLSSSGVRNSALAHMKPAWITSDFGQRYMVEIPRSETCNLGAKSGSGGDTSQIGRPCYQCRNRVKKKWAPDNADFTPKSEAAVRPIPIHDEDTVQILKSYFALNDEVTGINTITERVKEIADQAGLRKTTPHDLRDTYGTLLAKKGFGPAQIKKLMGHENFTQARDYIKLSGRDVQNEYEDKW